MPRSVAHFVNAMLLVLLVASGISLASRSILFGGLAVTALMYGAAWLVRWLADRYPKYVNAPNQARYDVLPRPDKQRVMAVVQRWIYWETAGLLTVLLALQWIDGYLALSGSERETYVLVGVLGFALLSTGAGPFLIWRVSATIDELHDQEDAQPAD